MKITVGDKVVAPDMHTQEISLGVVKSITPETTYKNFEACDLTIIYTGDYIVSLYNEDKFVCSSLLSKCILEPRSPEVGDVFVNEANGDHYMLCLYGSLRKEVVMICLDDGKCWNSPEDKWDIEKAMHRTDGYKWIPIDRSDAIKS